MEDITRKIKSSLIEQRVSKYARIFNIETRNWSTTSSQCYEHFVTLAFASCKTRDHAFAVLEKAEQVMSSVGGVLPSWRIGRCEKHKDKFGGELRFLIVCHF